MSEWTPVYYSLLLATSALVVGSRFNNGYFGYGDSGSGGKIFGGPKDFGGTLRKYLIHKV